MSAGEEVGTLVIDAADLDHAGTYRLLVGAVVPRPIAWVTSGIPPAPLNLAPFSSFTWVSPYPAMLGFNVAGRETGRKDTARNVIDDGEYVVNIASESMLRDVHASSEWFTAEHSESEHLGLRAAPSSRVRVPRLASAPVAMECELREVLKFGSTGSEFIVGEVVAFHVRESLFTDGKIDTELLRPLARVAGPSYAGLGPITTMPPVEGG